MSAKREEEPDWKAGARKKREMQTLKPKHSKHSSLSSQRWKV